jgi:hypothetical protein
MTEQPPAGPLGADVAVTHILVVADPARSRRTPIRSATVNSKGARTDKAAGFAISARTLSRITRGAAGRLPREARNSAGNHAPTLTRNLHPN